MNDRPSDHAIKFEAVKIAMNQTKDGYKLVLAVHPNEVPEELLRSFVGARYMIAAVELDHNDQIRPLQRREPLSDGEEDVRYAGQLCREPAFQRWMFRRGHCSKPDEEHAAAGLRVLLGIDSRSELKHNPEKRKILHDIIEAYMVDE